MTFRSNAKSPGSGEKPKIGFFFKAKNATTFFQQRRVIAFQWSNKVVLEHKQT